MKLPSNRPEDLLPEYKEAYDALPECYRADSCLEFTERYSYTSEDGECTNLYANHDLGGTYIWDEQKKQWLEILNGLIFPDSRLS